MILLTSPRVWFLTDVDDPWSRTHAFDNKPNRMWRSLYILCLCFFFFPLLFYTYFILYHSVRDGSHTNRVDTSTSLCVWVWVCVCVWRANRYEWEGNWKPFAQYSDISLLAHLAHIDIACTSVMRLNKIPDTTSIWLAEKLSWNAIFGLFVVR